MVKPQGVPLLKKKRLKAHNYHKSSNNDKLRLTDFEQFLLINACNILLSPCAKAKHRKMGKYCLAGLWRGERGGEKVVLGREKNERASEHTKHFVASRTHSFFPALAHLHVTPSPSPSEPCHTGFAKEIYVTLEFRVLYYKGRCESTLHYRLNSLSNFKCDCKMRWLNVLQWLQITGDRRGWGLVLHRWLLWQL